MTRGKVVVLAALTVIAGNFVAKRNATARKIWAS